MATLGQSPNQGRSPLVNNEAHGGAKPRLTSGGEADPIQHPACPARTTNGAVEAPEHRAAWCG